MWLISALTSWLSKARSIIMATTTRASSSLPLRANHLGLSGMDAWNVMANKANMTGRMSIARHCADVVHAVKKPKLIQFGNVIPALMNIPSIITNMPRCFVVEHSVCQTGMLAEITPIEAPTSNRPITNCANRKAEASIAREMVASSRPQKMVRRRPILSL